jgi:transcriptional regulator with XRE-family HTH domain
MTGEKLRLFRKEHDLTQEQLANALRKINGLEYTRSIISRMERGKMNIGQRTELSLIFLREE